MKVCLLLLVAGWTVTSSLPAPVWHDSQAGIREDRTPVPVGSPALLITDVPSGHRQKRDAANVATPSASVKTAFSNSHIHQPSINLTINNVFDKGIPSVSVLNDMFHFILTTFNNTHVHQPKMNITINNCF